VPGSRCLVAGAALCLFPAASGADSLLVVDHAKPVSRADLGYDRPASRSEEGMLRRRR
jgi:hypothetical protein